MNTFNSFFFFFLRDHLGEHYIDYPMHGPESVMKRIDTPPMPLPDGTYWVFGGYDLIGTCSFDAEGKPFIRLGTAASTMETLREVTAMQDWLDKLSQNDFEFPEGYPKDPAEFFDLTAKPYIVVPKPETE